MKKTHKKNSDNNCGENSGSVSIAPVFSKYDWMRVSHLGLIPFFILDSNILFLAVMYLFDITYLSKRLNHVDNICKMVKCWHTLQRAGTTSRGHRT